MFKKISIAIGFFKKTLYITISSSLGPRSQSSPNVVEFGLVKRVQFTDRTKSQNLNRQPRLKGGESVEKGGAS